LRFIYDAQEVVGRPDRPADERAALVAS